MYLYLETETCKHQHLKLLISHYVPLKILILGALIFKILLYFLYIDPGSGSMLIQMLIGAAVAIGIFFRKIKIAFLQLFKKKNKTSAIEEEN